MYTDTHCHILKAEYDNPNEIIENLKNNNIQKIIINGYDLESNKEVIELCNKYDNVYGAIGIHPDNINEKIEENIEFIKNNLNNPKIVAIGEIGLDYYHNKNNKQEQIQLLRKLCKIAKDNKLPIIVHNREATNDTISTLKEFNVKGIIHCFSGSRETAIEYIKMGYKLGIGGVITFKNSKLSEEIKDLPTSSFLLETDSPYLTPEPYRGKKNEPKYLKLISEKLSKTLNISEIELIKQLEINLNQLFPTIK